MRGAESRDRPEEGEANATLALAAEMIMSVVHSMLLEIDGVIDVEDRSIDPSRHLRRGIQSDSNQYGQDHAR